jgi:hypothetical protein
MIKCIRNLDGKPLRLWSLKSSKIREENTIKSSWAITQEDFIAFSSYESFKFYMGG